MSYLVSATLSIVGVIHLLPFLGVLGRAQLETLYGVPLDEPNLVILMRHRAVLFGLLGLFFLFAAFKPQYQLVAFVAGFVSVVSFLWLTWYSGGYTGHITRVLNADLIALACLVVSAVALLHQQHRLQ